MSLKTIKPISLDLYNNVLVSINSKQQDTESRYVKIVCTDNGKKSVLNRNEVRAFIRYKKPDGYYVLNDAEITEDGCVLVELTQQMLAVPGQAKADVLLADITKLDFEITEDTDFSLLKTSLLSTMYLNVNILPSAIDGSDIESSYEYNALLDTMMRMVVIEREITEFKQVIIDEENERQANEEVRIANENERIANENERKNRVDAAISDIEETIENAEKSVSDMISDANDRIDNTISEANTKINNAVSDAETATNNANTAASNANTAKANADTATKNANDAADRANTAAEECEGIVAGSNVIFQDEKGVANGVATLDVNAKVPVEQLPNMNDGNTIQNNIDRIDVSISDLGDSVQENVDAIIVLNEKSHIHTKPMPGSWFKGTPGVDVNGVTEVGKYIDFHNTDTTGNDYSTRLHCNGDTQNSIALPTTSGTLALLTHIPRAFNQLDSNGALSLETLTSYPTTAGVYRVGNPKNVTGLPDGIDGFGTLVLFNGGSFWWHQYIDIDNSIWNARTVTAEHTTGAPSEWMQQLDLTYTKPATDSDDKYYKFTDGTMIYTKSHDVKDTRCDIAWGSWYRTELIDLGSWQTKFVGIPSITLTFNSSDNNIGLVSGVISPSETVVGKCHIFRGEAADKLNGNIDVVAVGRWK